MSLAFRLFLISVRPLYLRPWNLVGGWVARAAAYVARSRGLNIETVFI